MTRILIGMVAFLALAGGIAVAEPGKAARPSKPGLPDGNLVVVDRSGRAVGPVVDGLTEGTGVFVAAATGDRKAYLINMFPDAFVAYGTVRYTGSGCTEDAYAEGVVDPAASFVEVAQIGVDPRNHHLSAFLIDREAEPADVAVSSYWYNGECAYDATTLYGARKLLPVKDLGAFSPPFSVTYESSAEDPHGCRRPVHEGEEPCGR